MCAYMHALKMHYDCPTKHLSMLGVGVIPYELLALVGICITRKRA